METRGHSGREPDHPRAAARRQSGTSLVELVIAVVVALLAVVGVVQMTLDSAAMRRTDEELNLALAACTAKIEELRGLTIDELVLQDGRGFDVIGRMGQSSGLSAQRHDPDGLPMLVEVVLIDEVSRDRLYRVEVSVEWTGAAGDRSFSLAAMFTDRRG